MKTAPEKLKICPSCDREFLDGTDCATGLPIQATPPPTADLEAEAREYAWEMHGESDPQVRDAYVAGARKYSAIAEEHSELRLQNRKLLMEEIAALKARVGNFQKDISRMAYIEDCQRQEIAKLKEELNQETYEHDKAKRDRTNAENERDSLTAKLEQAEKVLETAKFMLHKPHLPYENQAGLFYSITDALAAIRAENANP